VVQASLARDVGDIRGGVNLISALTNQGKVRFSLFEGTMDAKRKVYLILDNLRVHHANLLKQRLSEHSEKKAVFYLLAYSPKLDPDEYLNCVLKASVHSGAPARSKEQLKTKAMRHMRKLQKLPGRVASCFQHPCIQYAAWYGYSYCRLIVARV